MNKIDVGGVNWKAVLDEARTRAREYEIAHDDAYRAWMAAPSEDTKLGWWKAHDRLVQAYKECRGALEELRRAP